MQLVSASICHKAEKAEKILVVKQTKCTKVEIRDSMIRFFALNIRSVPSFYAFLQTA